MPKKFTPKLIKIRRKDFTSIIPKIVFYHRDGHGHPTHEVIHAFKTIRSYDVGVAFVRETFWSSVDLVLMHLQLSRGMSAGDAKRIRERFAEVIPVPFVLPTTPVAKPVIPTKKAALLAKFPILSSGK